MPGQFEQFAALASELDGTPVPVEQVCPNGLPQPLQVGGHCWLTQLQETRRLRYVAQAGGMVEADQFTNVQWTPRPTLGKRGVADQPIPASPPHAILSFS